MSYVQTIDAAAGVVIEQIGVDRCEMGRAVPKLRCVSQSPRRSIPPRTSNRDTLLHRAVRRRSGLEAPRLDLVLNRSGTRDPRAQIRPTFPSAVAQYESAVESFMFRTQPEA